MCTLSEEHEGSKKIKSNLNFSVQKLKPMQQNVPTPLAGNDIYFKDIRKPSSISEMQAAIVNSLKPTATKSANAINHLSFDTESTVISPILADNICGEIILCDVLVLRVQNKRLVSKAVQNLAHCVPVTQLQQHLKRVNRVSGEFLYHPVYSELLPNDTTGESYPNASITNASIDARATKSLTISMSENVSTDTMKEHFFIYVDFLDHFFDKSDYHPNGKLNLTSEVIEIASSPKFANLKLITNIDAIQLLKCRLQMLDVDISLFDPEYYISSVSRHPPRLRHLHSEALQYWPCTFHEDLYLSKMLSGDIFDKAERQLIIDNMNRTLCLANNCKFDEHFSSSLNKDVASCCQCKAASDNLSLDVKFAAGDTLPGITSVDNVQGVSVGRVSVPGALDTVPACLMYDSVKSRVVASAVASADSHPLAHAAMLAVHLVAHAQASQPSRAENTVPALLDVGTCSPSRMERIVHHPHERGSYICTGHWAFLSHEPCMMCSMALLHSRVDRVFYSVPSPARGALESVVKLHTLPGINHRYEVFKLTNPAGHQPQI